MKLQNFEFQSIGRWRKKIVHSKPYLLQSVVQKKEHALNGSPTQFSFRKFFAPHLFSFSTQRAFFISLANHVAIKSIYANIHRLLLGLVWFGLFAVSGPPPREMHTIIFLQDARWNSLNFRKAINQSLTMCECVHQHIAGVFFFCCFSRYWIMILLFYKPNEKSIHK